MTDLLEIAAEAMWEAESMRTRGVPRSIYWIDTAEKARDAYRHSAAAVLSALHEAGAIREWRPIETEPAPRKKNVLAGFWNAQGKWRTVKAAYYAAGELEASPEFEGGDYDEERDEYFCPPGWYESVEAETGLDYSLHYLAETITHWQPLPQPPEER